MFADTRAHFIYLESLNYSLKYFVLSGTSFRPEIFAITFIAWNAFLLYSST